MSKLDRYANASAGKREERIFLVFAKLNTKRDFSAFDLMALQDMNGELLQVAPKTMLSYLKAIQLAQVGQDAYQKHLRKPFDSHSYAVGDHEQLVYAREQYRKWQDAYQKHLRKPFDSHSYAVGDHEQLVYAREQYRKWQGLSKLPKEELVQFTFSSNHYLDPETFYTRLEQSLLVFGYLALKG